MCSLRARLFDGLYFDCTPAHVMPCAAAGRGGKAPRHRVPSLGGRARIRLLATHGIAGEIAEIFVRTTCDNEEHRARMKSSPAGAGLVAYSASIPILEKVTKVRFKIHTKSAIYWFNSRGVFEYHPNDYFDFRIMADSDIPEWVYGSVFYQIFPDRFHHGLSDAGYADREALSKRFEELYGGRPRYFGDIPPVLKRWDEKPDPRSKGYEFYFGTLDGVAKKLGHIKKLGANAIYFTPILRSPSNHRYDTEDYFRVDELLGGNAGFERFMKAAGRAGMRVILDAVFNHAGFSNDAFLRARAGEEPYCEFFKFYDAERKHYSCWLGNGNLPKFDYSSKKLREYIYASADSAAAKWLSEPYRIDGYRLDVAHMIGEGGTARGNIPILRHMREHIRMARPDAFILAENFFDCTEMLDGTSMDSVMNYHGFTFPVIDFISGRDHRGNPNRMDATAFLSWVWDVYAKMPQDHANAMFNQLSSHDISRHNSLLGDAKKILMAVALQFTFPGIPSIFYGDEIGLGGVGDPGCRAPMPWDESKWDKRLFEAYRALVRVRRRSKVLARGGFKPLYASGGALAFMRRYGREAIVTCVNRSSAARSVRIDQTALFIDEEGLAVSRLFDTADHAAAAKSSRARLANGILTLDMAPYGTIVIGVKPAEKK